MSNTWTVTYKYVPKEFRNVRGSISRVEEVVNKLIESNTGWMLTGDTYIIDIDGADVCVQPMARFEKSTF